MRSYTKDEKKSHILRFWIVTLLCAGMIGAASYFAYTQTANELTVQLEANVSSLSEMPPTEPPAPKPDDRVKLSTTPETSTTVEKSTTAIAAAARPETAPVTETVEVSPETTEADEFCKPIEGEILQPFSHGDLVKSPTTGVWQTHNGLDIAASLGEDVRAVAGGVVTQVEEDALWGVTVTIDHKNGVLSRYCNLSQGLAVAVGDAVEAGMVIGTIGSTADVESGEPSHLHLEIIKDGDYTDPEAFLPE